MCLFFVKKRHPKETQMGSMACAVLPIIILVLLFFRFLFPLHRREKRNKNVSLQIPPVHVYYRQTWIGTGSGCLPLQASRERCKAARGVFGEITRERGRERRVAASGSPPLQGQTSGAGAFACARRVVPRKIRSFAPFYTGTGGLLFSKKHWRRVCTTRYRRI